LKFKLGDEVRATSSMVKRFPNYGGLVGVVDHYATFQLLGICECVFYVRFQSLRGVPWFYDTELELVRSSDINWRKEGF
jgi:hypothetical protein